MMIDTHITPQTIAQRTVDRIDYVSAHDGVADWALMLHGDRSTGDQLLTRPDLRGVWLPAFEAANLNILCPHLRGDAWMGPAAAADLRDLIAMLRQRHGAK